MDADSAPYERLEENEVPPEGRDGQESVLKSRKVESKDRCVCCGQKLRVLAIASCAVLIVLFLSVWVLKSSDRFSEEKSKTVENNIRDEPLERRSLDVGSLGAWWSAKSWFQKHVEETGVQMTVNETEKQALATYGQSVEKSFSRSELKKIKKNDDNCYAKNEDPDLNCWGAPYLYVTYHGGSGKNMPKTVCKYSRNGCSLGSVTLPQAEKSLQSSLLRGVEDQDRYEPYSLRGMMIEKGFLYVAEAWKRNSRILQYSPCLPNLNGKRAFVRTFVSNSAMSAVEAAANTTDSNEVSFNDFDQVAMLDSPSSPSSPSNDQVAAAISLQPNGLIHPYGFARSPKDPYMYVSSQDTFAVLRFNSKTGKAGPVSEGLKQQMKVLKNMTEDALMKKYMAIEYPTNQMRQYAMAEALRKVSNKDDYAGLFVDLEGHEIRGIAFDPEGTLYVADKNQGVRMYDQDGFEYPNMLGHVERPLSIYYCNFRKSIWVSCAASHRLYEFDVQTKQLKQTIKDAELEHPAGLVSHADSLYVVSQAQGKLLRFSMSEGVVKDVVLNKLPDVGERVLLSEC